MRKLLTLVVLGVFVLPAWGQTAFVPTTTLTAETSNNTSAPDTISTLTQGHATSGNISKVPMRTLLYKGANTKVYAALMGWFGKSSHINVGYRSTDPVQVNQQIVDMKSRGIDGAILAWYGKDSYENKTALALKAAAEANGVEFSIMIDRGTLDWDSMGLAPTDAMIVHLNYIADTYYSSPMYTKINGRPVVYEFALEAYTIDWVRVRSSIRGNPLIIFRNPNGWTRPTTDGAYAWDPSKPTTSYLDYFYQQSTYYPTLQTVGGVSPMMNDTLASWSENRIVDPQCGQTWLMKWADQSKWFSTTKPLQSIQIATWNDYEEGTTIESGIDNCVTVNAVVSGSTLSWSISGPGLENTIDHYTVYLSQDGQNLMKLAGVSTSVHSLELDPYKFPTGNYSVFVQAVGKPALTNKMSAPTSYTSTFVPNRPPVAVLNVSSSSAYTPSTVTADATGTSDPDNNLSSTVINWGDGTSSAAKLAMHVYNSAGTYNVTVTATDTAGLTSTASSSITVQAANVAIASPTVNSSWLSTIRVEANANNGNPISGMWVYVDNVGVYNVKGSSVATDLKMTAGTHTVLVKAWDIYNNITRSSTQVNVTIPNQAPVAKIGLSAPSLLAGATLTVNSSGSYDPDGTIASTYISFGDGTIINAATASHVYSAPGTYMVTVTVTDNQGAISRAIGTITVTAPGVTISKPAASSTSYVTNMNVVASASALKPISSMIVYVDNNRKYTTYSAKVNTYIIVPSGTHTILVKAWDNGGTIYSKSVTITVK